MELATLIAALASCLTALVGLFTIYEMKKQRESSYKPFLCFDFISLKVNEENGKILFNGKQSFQPEIVLHNIGNGTATNISIDWKINYDYIVKQIQKLDIEHKLKINLSKSLISIESCTNEFDSKFGGTTKDRSEFFDVLEAKETCSNIQIPHLLKNCISVLLFLERNSLISQKSSKRIDSILKIKLPVKIIVNYNDMQNKYWKRRMSFIFDFDFVITQLDNGNLETDFLNGYIKIV